MMNQQICRCCLRENPANTYNLFEYAAPKGVDVDVGVGAGALDTAGLDLVQVQNRNSRLYETILACAPKLHIEPDDGLPDVICEHCWLCVREMLEFRRRCEDSERELRRRYADTERAIEEALKIVHLLDNKATPTCQTNNALNVVPPFASEEDSSFASDLSLLDDLLLGDATLDGLLDAESRPASSLQIEEPPLIKELLNKVISELEVHEEAPVMPNAERSLESSHKCDNNNSSTITASTTTDSNSQCTLVQTPPLSVCSSPMSTKSRGGSTPKSLYPCPECEKKFTRNFQLKLHLISVHKLGDGLQYKCEECAKTFASRHSLSYHQKSVHSTERPYACSYCDRRFVLRTQLSSHLRVHTGEAKPRIFECMECGKRWPTKSDLRTHMRRHVDALERPFKCSECSKAFFTRGHLNSHLLVHTGEKPFACGHCDKSYQCVGNLNNHLVRHHPEMVAGGGGRNRAVMLEI